MERFSHLDESGKAVMVEVGEKPETVREAVARGRVLMRRETLEAISHGTVAKGDVFAVARLAGIMAAKSTASLIPLCHPVQLTGVQVDFRPAPDLGAVLIEARARSVGRTGVEMEALTAVSVAALTIYDMCKAVDRDMMIDSVRLVLKTGGKSGTYTRAGESGV
ncbi:MAG: cyclic pyranopterin monophosphate synthase MoaC [Bacillota bacterium]